MRIKLILTLILQGLLAFQARAQTCNSLFEKKDIDTTIEQFQADSKTLGKLGSSEEKKARFLIKRLIENAKVILDENLVSFTIDPQDPEILLIRAIKPQKKDERSLMTLNAVAYSHSKMFQLKGANDSNLPLTIEYNPRVLFEQGTVALFSEARSRLSLSHEHIVTNSYDDFLGHEETHADFFYNEMTGVENHLQGYISKNNYLRPISYNYKHDFNFDELAAYSRQVILGLQQARPNTKVKMAAVTGGELAQAILHSDLARFSNVDLPAIIKKEPGWVTRRIRKQVWGETRAGLLISNSKSNSRVFAFEAPLLELSDSAKKDLSPAQVRKFEYKKVTYFMVELDYHYVFIRTQDKLNFEKREKLLQKLNLKIQNLRTTAKAVKTALNAVELKLQKGQPEAALQEALALKPYIEVLSDETPLTPFRRP